MAQTKTIYLPSDGIQNRLRDLSLYIRYAYPDGVTLVTLNNQCHLLIKDLVKHIKKRDIKVNTDVMLCQLDVYDTKSLIVTQDLSKSIKDRDVLVVDMFYCCDNNLLCLAKKILLQKKPNKLNDFVLLYKVGIGNRTDMCNRKVSYYGFYYTDNVGLRGYGIDNDNSPDIYIK